MANTVEVKVPDIGNFDGVPVIEILVKPGDTVAKDQGLVTLESDKATMEVPSSVAGVVKEIRVKLDDKVAEGAVVAVIEAADAASSPSPLRGEGRGEGGGGGPPSQLHRLHRPPRRRLPRKPKSPARPPPPAPAASPTSNARWSCSAPAPAATRLRSAPPT
jgi:dihydrolipoamide dehydrogenase